MLTDIQRRAIGNSSAKLLISSSTGMEDKDKNSREEAVNIKSRKLIYNGLRDVRSCWNINILPK